MVEIELDVDPSDVLDRLNAYEIINASNDSLVDFIEAIFRIAYEDKSEPASLNLLSEVENQLKVHGYMKSKVD